MGWKTGELGIDSRQVRRFFLNPHSVHTGLRPPNSLSHSIPLLFSLRIKRPGLLAYLHLVSVSRTELRSGGTPTRPQVFIFYLANKRRAVFICTFCGKYVGTVNACARE
jgi:hypothetical protein